MRALSDLQQRFQAHLLDDAPQIKDDITGITPQLITQRLGIYSHAYRWRLVEALEVTYEPLVKYMGGEAFAEMGLAYIKLYPSYYYGVDMIGQYLPNFLAMTEPYAAKPYLSELAQLIWTLFTTIDAPNSDVIPLETIGAIPQEQWPYLHFKFVSSMRLEQFTWNVLAIWQAIIQDQTPPEPKQLNETEKYNTDAMAAGYCGLWRKGSVQPYYVPLTVPEAWMHQAISDNQSFGDICDGLLQWYAEEDAANVAVNLLIRWLKEEMIAEVMVREEISTP